MSAGFVRVSRDLLEDEAFADEAFSEREAFLWLIFEASFKAREKRVGSAIVKLGRGQVAASTRFMAKAWKWSESRVRRYLDRLKNRRMVSCVADAGVTVVTLCNYDKYQSPERVSDAEKTQQPARRRRTGDANENKVEIRDIDLALSPDGEDVETDDPDPDPSPAPKPEAASRFDDFWQAYPHRNGVKKGRKPAEVKFAAAVKRGVAEATIIAGAKAAHAHPDVVRGYSRDPVTWLHQEGWRDEFGPSRPGGGGGTGGGYWTSMGYIAEAAH